MSNSVTGIAFTTLRRYLRGSAIFWTGLGVFVLTVLIVGPRREMALDDDWIYAITVRNFMSTGTYKLYQWSAANILFQAYWGRLFVGLFGYSFTSLRASTLVLTFVGLLAFYGLARASKLERFQAAVLSAVLFSSPFVVLYSFCFNSDVPFLMCAVVALLLYTRGIERKQYSAMLVASAFASAAILTRQFGLALPGGVVLLWALDKDRLRRGPLFLVGLLLPAIAGFWQLRSGLVVPTSEQRMATYAQSLYFADSGTMVKNAFWRLSVTLQYLALFSLPLVFLLVLHFLPRVTQFLRTLGIDRRQCIVPEGRANLHSRAVSGGTLNKLLTRKLVVLLASTFYVIGGVVYGRVAMKLGWFMPYLPWDVSLLYFTRWQRGLWTFVTSVGAVVYAYILVVMRCHLPSAGLSPAERLLGLFTLLLAIEHVIFFKFGDRYVLGFLPFIIIILGRELRDVLSRHTEVAAGLCVVMLLVSATWARGVLSEAEATWTAAESVRSEGVEPRRIFGRLEWNAYYGAMDEWLSEIGDAPRTNHDDFYYRWYVQRRRTAEFVVTTSPSSEDGTVVRAIPYTDTLFRQRHIYVLKRSTPQ